ncbi:P-loop containing nucleoside triphosphate hydrolase protein [Hypoxylon sp. FL0890]|nr:P-loop containing nucleoside triphosphate hydrolase protein [Hypoxylon sp. FL0890]
MAKKKKKGGQLRQTPDTNQPNPGHPVNPIKPPNPVPSPSSINLSTPVKPVNPVRPVDPITPPVEPASPINPASQVTEEPSSPPVEVAEEFIPIQENNGTAEGFTKSWGYGTDDKESQVHFFDSSFTRLSFEDSERNPSEVLAADFNAGSTHSADEGYEHVSSQEQRAPDFSQYDQLPRLPPPVEPLRTGPRATGGFDVEKVIGAIQNGYSSAELREYLSYYYKAETTLLKENLNAEVRGFPATFYVVETNDAELVRYWIKYGGDPNATHGILRFPLLAFAILRGARARLQATRTVETLLRLGASPRVIPAAYYNPFDRDVPENGPDEKELYDIGDDKFWCTPELRPRLAAALSFTQRYRLWQASRQEPTTGRERTLAIRKDAVEILGLQYTIIGQRVAAWSLRKSFLVHLAMPFRKPLVLLFAGPRGHGKKELVNKLAYLLSLDVQKVDCTNLNGYDEIFGPKQPGQEYSCGSPLNDFLASKSKERSIVFMEEFDKTNKDIHKELLVPFDRGVYMDRRNGQKVDSSQTIWILSTSKFDETISDFIIENGDIGDSDLRSEQYLALRRQLLRRLRNDCIASFGAPLTSRITEIIPFLTFNVEEQELIADKYIMELESLIAGPVVKSADPDEDRLIGNVQLQITNNASVCSVIAKDHYLPEFGASSISHGIDATITNQLISRYLEDGDDFSEDQAETRYRVGTNEDNEVEVLPELRSDDTNGYAGLGYSWMKGR